MKRCPSCKLDKPKDAFLRHVSRRDGLSAYCAECMTAKYIARRQSAAYVEQNKTRAREWREAHKKEIQQCRRKYWLANAEKLKPIKRRDYAARSKVILQQQREWRRLHPERAKANIEKWRSANPEKVREMRRLNENKRRARLARVLSTLTKRQWEAILAFYDNRCAYCGADGKMEQEHVVPVCRGGGTTADNIVPACSACNQSKHAKTPEEWKSLN